ncbi:MBL fold metallo-hydrolase [Halomonas icarae]|uniref:MBL fold metallo-hydrolase n=1 Tax=Halomonas icarae TaxID=2691040 RepID=A0A7X4W1M0_9GAMM|nr:MBL fold metallo-hydrolase [Halomonas icarae]MDR5903397.1 MBL fold metallo-hydrolase [Halomonas icarae]NAW14241.1 MBL fold metallo-hydrolase [Halomonas icarae]
MQQLQQFKGRFGALFLALGVSLSLSAGAADDQQEARLVLLGTAGGPSAKAARAQPANALVIGDDVYIIDAGDGVVRQMILAGISPRDLRAVFLTHQHSDHNVGYCPLLVRSWASGQRDDIDAYGPEPLQRMTDACMALNEWDITLRQVDEGRPDLTRMVKVHEITADGVIYQDDNVTVTAFEVPHGAAEPSYGLRFDTAEHAIVFSGDTSGGDNLIQHAQDADILVHEVVSVPGVEALVERIDPGNDALVRHIVEAHTPPEEVGRIAKSTGVDTLVLNHFVPTGGPSDNDQSWYDAASSEFDGHIIVGQDLMEIPLTKSPTPDQGKQ